MIRKIARPMLASVFVADGVDTLMNQQDHLDGAREVLSKVRAVVPAQYSQLVPKDPQTAVQAVAGTKVAAGAQLHAIPRPPSRPRTSATALAVVQVPTILARHSFWETQDPKERKARQTGFFTSIGLLGGLALATADTAGKPGLAWRAEHAGKQVNKKVQKALPTKSETEKRTAELQDKASGWMEKAQEFGHDVQEKAAVAYERAGEYVDDNKDDWKDSLQTFAEEARETLASATETARETFADVADATADQTKQARKDPRKSSKRARKQLKKM